MNIDFLKDGLIGVYSMDFFVRYYIDTCDLKERYQEVHNYMISGSRAISRLARDLYVGLIYSELSKIDYLGFSDSLDKKQKVGILAANGIVDINDDDDRLLSLLKGLGEEKVLKTLCDGAVLANLRFMRGLK